MRRGNIFWGLILIFGGILFLLNSMGFFQGVNIWGMIWPLFLILLGSWILLGRLFWRETTEDTVVDLEGATRGRLTLKHGAGRLEVGSGAGSNNLLEGTFVGGVDTHTRRQGDLLDTTLSVKSENFPWMGNSALNWDILLNSQTPLSLVLNTGAGENILNLTDLQIQDLRLQTGASASRIKLPVEAGFTTVSVESGAASVVIEVPQGVAARIMSGGGLSSFDIDAQRFPRSGLYNQSADYESATNRVDINVQMGVGSVEVK